MTVSTPEIGDETATIEFSNPDSQAARIVYRRSTGFGIFAPGESFSETVVVPAGGTAQRIVDLLTPDDPLEPFGVLVSAVYEGFEFLGDERLRRVDPLDICYDWQPEADRFLKFGPPVGGRGVVTSFLDPACVGQQFDFGSYVVADSLAEAEALDCLAPSLFLGTLAPNLPATWWECGFAT